jgi:hypothetical protein
MNDERIAQALREARDRLYRIADDFYCIDHYDEGNEIFVIAERLDILHRQFAFPRTKP